MLLPSALSCDYNMAQPKPHRSSRPKLPCFDSYDPCRRSQSPVFGLIASCRALQNMLGERFASTPSPLPSPSIDSTIYAKPLASPFGEPTPPYFYSPAPRGSNKRRRSCSNEDRESQCQDTTVRERNKDLLATPKRRRVLPIDLPPGLQASDFEALANITPTTTRTSRAQCVRQVELPIEEKHPVPDPEQPLNTWTENDDRLLVEVVLSKLNLSTREWNDCALRLGKDKDSLGRRWQLLLGEGNIGLRRGVGRMGRVDLDIKSWQ